MTPGRRDVRESLAARAQNLRCRAGRIQLSRDDAVQQLAEPPVVGQLPHQLAADPGRRDRQHLVAQVPLRRSPSVPLASMCARCSASASSSSSTPSPRWASVRRTGTCHPSPGTERQHAADVAHHRRGERVIGLVDDDHVRDLHHAGFQRLDRIAGAGHQHQHDGVSVVDARRPRPARCRRSRSSTMSRPEASISSAAWSVASLRPPRTPRLAIERMNTPGSRK